MVSPRKPRPSVDDQPMVVTAPTLKEAYRRIKSEFGEDAVILNSRTINQRQSLGLGNQKMVEVTVQPPGTHPSAGRTQVSPLGASTTQPETKDNYSSEISREVERIEELVTAIQDQYADHSRQAQAFSNNPLAHTLLESGAKASTVEKLITRFTSETGEDANNRVAGITWLTDNIRASNCQWDGFYGCHAFLGKSGCGRTKMVYATAAKLQELGRKTLVLAVMPDHTGEVRRLQSVASELGFDAAVIQDKSQLAKSESHLARYDAVLVDLPAFTHPAMASGGPLHNWLASNEGFHRHLVLPLDSDPEDLPELSQLAKDWHTDWVAISRMDLSRRKGKFLDFGEAIPTPFSLLGQDEKRGEPLVIAGSGMILDLILGNEVSGSTTRFEEGSA